MGVFATVRLARELSKSLNGNVLAMLAQKSERGAIDHDATTDAWTDVELLPYSYLPDYRLHRWHLVFQDASLQADFTDALRRGCRW